MGVALRKGFAEYSPIVDLLVKTRKKVKPVIIGGDPGLTPILRWAGSKKKLLPVLLDQALGECSGVYHEPFVGSGALFLQMKAKKAVLSDLNPHLMQAYKQVKNHPEAVWEMLSKMPSNIEFYYSLRQVNWITLNSIERAARFVYLNRFCFNGVYRTNLNGDFNVARGDGHLGIPSWDIFKAFANRLKKASLVEADFGVSIDKAVKGDFIYIDPPYVDLTKRNRGEYGLGSFGEEDISRLARAANQASKRGAKIMLSYRHSDELISLFKGWNVRSFDVQRTVSCDIAKRHAAKEILLTNY